MLLTAKLERMRTTRRKRGWNVSFGFAKYVDRAPGEALKLLGGITARDVALAKTRQRSAKESEHASA